MITDTLWDPAGGDLLLRNACLDLQKGIFGSAREILGRTREQRNFTARGYQSALLALFACRSVVAEQWAQEAPKNPDAQLLVARVRVIRVMNRYNADPSGVHDELGDAWKACYQAAHFWDDDPTPWAAILAMSRTNRWWVQSPPPAELAGLKGPWDVTERVWARDRFNREAGHRLVSHFSPRNGGRNAHVARVAAFVASGAAPDDPIQLLPLAAEVEYDPTEEPDQQELEAQFNRRAKLKALIADIDEGRALGEQDWLMENRNRLMASLEMSGDATRAGHLGALRDIAACLFDEWFPLGGGDKVPAGVPVSDLSLLALGLSASKQYRAAGTVLRHIAPYASRYPWSRQGDPEAVLRRVHRACDVTFPVLC